MSSFLAADTRPCDIVFRHGFGEPALSNWRESSVLARLRCARHFGRMDPMVEYYSQRASEYEEIYHREDPNRQKELAQMALQLRDACLQRSVLEVACGTG